MDFKDTQPIYLQIAQYISQQISSGQWGEHERIPSVRELGADLGVNPNTCIRAYDHLTRLEIIAPSRGIGYSVLPGARERLLTIERQEFFAETLPQMIERIKSLGIEWQQVEEFYRNTLINETV